MPYKDPEKRRQHAKEYRKEYSKTSKFIESNRRRSKEHYAENREERIEKERARRKDPKVRERQRELHQNYWAALRADPVAYEHYKYKTAQRSAERRKDPKNKLIDCLTSARRRSRNSGVACDLTKEWLLEQFDRQGGCCALTGISFSTGILGKVTHFKPFTPSLDRIIPGGDYSRENVRLVCTAANLALNGFGEDIFEQVCLGFLERKGYVCQKK